MGIRRATEGFSIFDIFAPTRESGDEDELEYEYDWGTSECVCPDLTDTNFGLIALLLVSCLVTRTFCCAQEIIRHKRTTSRAARGPLPFIPFIS